MVFVFSCINSWKYFQGTGIQALFLCWFDNKILKHCGRKTLVALIMDNYVSHYSMDLLEKAKKYQVFIPQNIVFVYNSALGCSILNRCHIPWYFIYLVRSLISSSSNYPHFTTYRRRVFGHVKRKCLSCGEKEFQVYCDQE